MMWGIVCILLSCCLFVHLGLADAILRVTRIKLPYLRCAKCLSFWSVLIYSLMVVPVRVEVSVLLAFVCAYAALWIELLLGSIANIYEKVSNSMDAEASASASASEGDEEDSTKGEESPLP